MSDPQADPRELASDEQLDPEKLLWVNTLSAMPVFWDDDGEERTSIAIRFGGFAGTEGDPVALTILVSEEGLSEVALALVEQATHLNPVASWNFIQKLFATLKIER